MPASPEREPINTTNSMIATTRRATQPMEIQKAILVHFAAEREDSSEAA